MCQDTSETLYMNARSTREMNYLSEFPMLQDALMTPKVTLHVMK